MSVASYDSACLEAFAYLVRVVMAFRHDKCSSLTGQGPFERVSEGKQQHSTANKIP